MNGRAPILIPDKGEQEPPSGGWRTGLVVLAVVATVAGLTFAWWDSNREPEPEPGFAVDQLVRDTLGPDETLGTFLARHAIDSVPVFEALGDAGVDPGTVPEGLAVTMVRASDSKVVTAIRFPVDDEQRVGLELNDRRWTAVTEARSWSQEIRIIAGSLDDRMLAVIDSTAAARLQPASRQALRSLLASALAWQIDVGRRIVPGDSFRAIVTVSHADDGHQRIGDIQALDLTGRGQRLTGYRFGSSISPAFAYFDEHGRPLGRRFLRAPLLSDGRQSSRFKPLRIHPVLGTVRAHRGVDFPAPEGTPVVAAAAGMVAFAGFGNDLGNFVVIAHGKGVTTRYGHFSRIADGVVPGARVRPGTIIGAVGRTGLATAPHLHFEFRIWDEPIDMRLLDVDPEAPILPPYRAPFDAERARLQALLNR